MQGLGIRMQCIKRTIEKKEMLGRIRIDYYFLPLQCFFKKIFYVLFGKKQSKTGIDF
jgi:hypothetical protein